MPEDLLSAVIDAVVLAVEATGAAVIAAGALWATVRFVVSGIRHRDMTVFTPIRLTLGRFLTLGLEFQLAADILRTAVSPGFEEIGQLAAIAAIRTAVNYFLRKEIKEEERQVGQRADAAHPDPAPS